MADKGEVQFELTLDDIVDARCVSVILMLITGSVKYDEIIDLSDDIDYVLPTELRFPVLSSELIRCMNALVM